MSENNAIYSVAESTYKTAVAAMGNIAYFPLQSAVLCGECENVSNGNQTCPACGSTALMSVSKAMGGGVGTETTRLL